MNNALAPSTSNLSMSDFQYLSNLVYKNSGIVLGADKLYLIESRLLPVAREFGFRDITELSARLNTNPSEEIVKGVVEAMTTNETFFFRDNKPFMFVRQVALPEYVATRIGNKNIRIWSAAASTGQEAYSIAITIKEEAAKLGSLSFDIEGTDICSKAIDRANQALYSQFEVQRGMPVQMMLKYFTQEGQSWRVKPEIKSMAKFKVYNLLHDFTPLGRFDMVFCRNVLIYFDEATKKSIITRLSQIMNPGSYILLGAAETTVGYSDKFAPVEGWPGVFKLK
jgi:chemotaxis protein methyltransferase CheR